MPSSLALLLWVVCLVTLFLFDPAKTKTTKPSLALWVPLIWMFIIGSRLVSQWLGGGGSIMVAQSLEEGNPVDRAISLALIVLAISILASRAFKWDVFFSRNLVLTFFLFFALCSVCWSDFPFVAFKRWIRDLGNYLVVLVALSDPQPVEAVRMLMRRLFFLLISLSILLVKYFPEMAKQYDAWSGIATFSGATTSKNMLGVACLISGLFFFWDTVARWANRKDRRTKRIIWVNATFIAMTLYLLNLCNSATSRVCLALGCLVIIATRLKIFQRRPMLLKALIPSILGLYLVLALGFGINGQLAGAVGRDPTLTDRTKIWDLVLSLHTNPIVGVGYESFWLGRRLETVWQVFPGINESHNGYLEVYLNQGIIGVFLLGLFLIASYRNICKRGFSSGLGSLNLALWTIALVYNVTEAAFKGQLMWLVFLVGAITIPERVRTISTQSSRSAIPTAPSDPILQLKQPKWHGSHAPVGQCAANNA